MVVVFFWILPWSVFAGLKIQTLRELNDHLLKVISIAKFWPIHTYLSRICTLFGALYMPN